MPRHLMAQEMCACRSVAHGAVLCLTGWPCAITPNTVVQQHLHPWVRVFACACVTQSMASANNHSTVVFQPVTRFLCRAQRRALRAQSTGIVCRHSTRARLPGPLQTAWRTTTWCVAHQPDLSLGRSLPLMSVAVLTRLPWAPSACSEVHACLVSTVLVTNLAIAPFKRHDSRHCNKT